MSNFTRLLATCSALLIMSHVRPQCSSWCVNTGTATISQTPSCYGESYYITIAGEYSSGTWGNGTWPVGPGTYTFDFISYCYTQTPYQYCCATCYDENGQPYCCQTCTACDQYNYVNEHSVTITIPEYACTMEGSATGHAPSAFGCNDGSITYSGNTNACNGFTVYGPSGWQGQGNGTISGLAPGQYTLYFYSDPGGCVDEVLVTVPSAPCQLSAEITTVNASSAICADGSIAVTGNSGPCVTWTLWLSRAGIEQYWGTYENGATASLTSLLPGSYTVRLEHGDGVNTCQQLYPVTISSPGCVFPFTTSTVDATAGGTCYDGRIVLDNITGCDWVVSIFHTDSTAAFGGYWYSWYASDTVPSTFVPGTYHIQASRAVYDPFTEQTITCEQWTTVVVGEPCQLDATVWTADPSSLACPDGAIHVSSTLGSCFQQQAFLYLLGEPEPFNNALAPQGDTISFTGLMPGTYVLHTQSWPWVPGGCEQWDTLTIATPACVFPYTISTTDATSDNYCHDGRIILENNANCYWLVTVIRTDSTVVFSNWSYWYPGAIEIEGLAPGTYLIQTHDQTWDGQNSTCESWATVVVGQPCQLDATIWTEATSSSVCADGSIHVSSTLGSCFQQQALLYLLGEPEPFNNALAPQGDTISFTGLMPGTYVLHTQSWPWVPGGCEQRDTLVIISPDCLFPFTTSTVDETAGGACNDGRIVLDNNTNCDWIVTIYALDSSVVYENYWHPWYVNDTVPSTFIPGTYLIQASRQVYDPFTEQLISCESWATVVVGEPCQLDATIWTEATSSSVCADGSIHVSSTLGSCFQQQASLYLLGETSPVNSALAPQGDTISFTGLMPGTYVLLTQSWPWVPGGCEQRDTLVIASPGCSFPFTASTADATSIGACGDGRIVLKDNTACDWQVTIMHPDSTPFFGPASSLSWWFSNDTIPLDLAPGTFLINAERQVYDPFTQAIVTCSSWATVTVNCEASVLVNGRVYMEGPYDPNTASMSDHLRASGLLPSTEPYTTLGYGHTGNGGGETVQSGVFSVTGTNAIVDWVILELRSPGSPSTILASHAALVQRDGDIVAMDGTSPVSFPMPAGPYHVAVLHRNHLGCMTSGTMLLNSLPTSVDFTNAALATHGTDARRVGIGGMLLWAGDVNFDGQVIYTGNDNDRDPVLFQIGGSIPTNSSSGYNGTDVNLDGITRYTGDANDRDPILVTIGGTVPTVIRPAQLPW